MPPVPAFYHRPQTLDDVINQTVNRVLDQFDIDLPEDLFYPLAGGVKLCTNKVHERTICPVSGQNCNRDHILDI